MRTWKLGLILLTAVAFLAAGPASPAGAQSDTDVAELELTIRDFSEDHPDFQEPVGSESGIVEAELGDDRKPVYAHGEDGSGSGSTSGRENFDQWFRDVEGVNFTTTRTIELTKTGQTFAFSDPDFFPLDDDPDFGWGFEGRQHNFWFSAEIHTEFAYDGAEVFEFSGDDDVFVFLNDRLAIDLGGVHNNAGEIVLLDEVADEFGLEPGDTYPLDLFFVERHTNSSTFSIDTTLALRDAGSGVSVWDALREPGDVGFSVERLMAAAAIAAVLLLIVFPAELFNSTFEANYGEIRGWFRRGKRPPNPKSPEARRALSWRRDILVLLGPVLVIGIFGALLKPDLGTDGESIAWFLGTVIAVLVSTVVPLIVWLRTATPRNQDVAHLEVYPGALVVAGICVAVSRLSGFLPGYLYGTAAGVEYTPESNREQAGRRALVGMAVLAALAFVAWMLWALIHNGGSAPVAKRVVEATLVNIYTVGWGGLLIGLIPIRFLPGHDVYRWNRLAWAGALVVIATLLLYSSALPDAEYDGSLATLLAMFIGFGMVSVAFWAYFRFRPAPAGIAVVVGERAPEPVEVD